MAVFIGDDEPGQEGAEGEGKTCRVGQRRHGQTDENRGEQEELPALGPGDPVENPRHDPAGGGNREEDDAGGLGQQEQDVFLRYLGRTAQEGQQDHHRDHDEVLIDQDTEGVHPLRRFDFRPVLKEFHDDGGAAQGREKPDEDRLSPGLAEGVGDCCCRGERECHLEGPAEERRTPDLEEILEGEFQADGEEQGNDADLGELRDRLDVPDQAKAVGAREQARQKKAHDNRNLEPVAEIEHGGGKPDDEKNVVQEKHGSSLERMRTAKEKAATCLSGRWRPDRHKNPRGGIPRTCFLF